MPSSSDLSPSQRIALPHMLRLLGLALDYGQAGPEYEALLLQAFQKLSQWQRELTSQPAPAAPPVAHLLTGASTTPTNQNLIQKTQDNYLTEIETLQQENTQLQDRLAELEQELAGKEQTIADLNSKLSELSAQLKKLSGQMEQLKQQNKALKTRLPQQLPPTTKNRQGTPFIDKVTAKTATDVPQMPDVKPAPPFLEAAEQKTSTISSDPSELPQTDTDNNDALPFDEVTSDIEAYLKAHLGSSLQLDKETLGYSLQLPQIQNDVLFSPGYVGCYVPCFRVTTLPEAKIFVNDDDCEALLVQNKRLETMLEISILERERSISIKAGMKKYPNQEILIFPLTITEALNIHKVLGTLTTIDTNGEKRFTLNVEWKIGPLKIRLSEKEIFRLMFFPAKAVFQNQAEVIGYEKWPFIPENENKLESALFYPILGKYDHEKERWVRVWHTEKGKLFWVKAKDNEIVSPRIPIIPTVQLKSKS